MKAFATSLLLVLALAAGDAHAHSHLNRSMDGKTVVCETKADAIGNKDAYVIDSHEVKVVGKRLTVRAHARFLVCKQNAQGVPSWIETAPGAPLAYDMPVAKDQWTHVVVTTENLHLVTSNSATYVFAKAYFKPEGNHYVAEYDIDLDHALSREEQDRRSRGHIVQVRVELNLRSDRYYSVDGGPREFLGTVNGGSYFLTVDLDALRARINTLEFTRR